jgi:uroporphyrinogen-III synthase
MAGRPASPRQAPPAAPTVLVPRPRPAAQRTARALADKGYTPLLAPLFTVATLNGGRVPPPPPGTGFAGVVAASANAFAALARESRDALAGLPALVVGERTREAAREAGLAPLAPACRTARDLASALGEALPEGHLLYLAGRDRRPEIEVALAARRAGFTLAETYASVMAPALPEAAGRALRRGQVTAVLHYSARSAKAYLALARRAGLETEALAPAQLCLSSAIGAVLAREGAPRVAACAVPEEAHLLALLPPLAA